MSKFKMLLTKNAIAKHSSGSSSINNVKVLFVRNLNFKYGEYLYDFKIKRFRLVKLVRQLFQSIIFFVLGSLSLNKKIAVKHIAGFFAIIKFINFCIKK